MGGGPPNNIVAEQLEIGDPQSDRDMLKAGDMETPFKQSPNTVMRRTTM